MRSIQTLQSMAVFGNYGGRNPELHVLAQHSDDVYDPIFTAEDAGLPISCFVEASLTSAPIRERAKHQIPTLEP